MMQEKKTTVRITSLLGVCLLCLCMVFCLLADMSVEAAETLTSGDWTYMILEDQTVGITDYNGKGTDVVIPDEIDGKSVVHIENFAFLDYSRLTSINIPSSVTSIGDYAFKGCSNLTNITIPNNVTSIGNNAFKNCRSLTNIEIPSGVTSIGDYVFYNCSSLTSINIPSSVVSIENNAFYNCSSLTNITIPSSVTNIEDWAFSYCSSLTSINIPSSVTSIGEWTFSHCSSLTSIEIPSNVTNIGFCAFKGCSRLTDITIPSSVTSIGNEAFSDCSNLTSIEIPSSVTNIGPSTFEGCSSDLTIYGEPGSYAEEYVKANGMEFKCSHTPVTDLAIDPTCTKKGKTEGSHCSVCDAIIKAQKDIPATGHTYKKTTQKATTKKNGLIEEKCITCGYTKSRTDIYAASSIKLSKTSFTYNGKNKKPAVTVKDSKGNKLQAGSYKVTYPKTSKKVGKYTVTITLQGNYNGTVKLTYRITPKGTKLSKLTAKKKGFTAKWKKQTRQTTGYQLQYSTSKKFKGAKTVTVKKNKTISKNIKKLKAGKKYYVRIRTYKTVKVNGKSVKICSGWSKAKSVKTKK